MEARMEELLKKLVALMGATTLAIAAMAGTADASRTTYKVCAHGCKYHSVQKAVDAVKKGSKSTVLIEPGTYNEGVFLVGHRYDHLHIIGDTKNPKKVVLNGAQARTKRGTVAQNGIESTNVDGLVMENIWAKNFADNGFFVHSDPDDHCIGFLMKNDLASFNRSYGLFAQNCEGGRITQSKGWGQGDSAIYIGQTPVQNKPKWTSIDHNVGFENVLGYSGTNSKYVDIHDNDFYNNGIGVVPNTLDSELYEPTADGKIRNNNIFWNNFDYWRASSKVMTVSAHIGQLAPGVDLQYPIGIGIYMLGADGWKITDNNIFGNFKWGVAASSDPTNTGDNAINQNNVYTGNKMGRGGKDKNQFDFFNDGSGSGNCFSDNHSQVFDESGVGSPLNDPISYAACPTGGGSGSSTGPQIGYLLGYVISDDGDGSNPPCNMENSWAKHSHPKFKNYKPLTTTGDCTNRPQLQPKSAAKLAAVKRATPKVTVSNDFYAPTSVKVAKGNKVKWNWLNASDGHNVTAYSVPNGVHKNDFRSPTQTTGSWTRKFKKPGTYKFHCTIHPLLMQMTVKVKR